MNYALLIALAYFGALVAVGLNVPAIGAAVFLIGLVMFPHIMSAIPWAIPAYGLGAGDNDDPEDEDHQNGPMGFVQQNQK